MNQVVAFSNFCTLVLIDVDFGRYGAGTSVLGSPVVAPVRLATLA